MKLLLIGGCGYIGSRLYRHLRSEGHVADTVDLELRGNPVNPRNLRRDYRQIHAEYIQAVKNYDAVIMLAGHSSVEACEAEPWAAYDNNLTGLVELVRKLEGQPFIYASSASVYAVIGDRFRNMYDFTKFAGDAVVKLLYPRAYGLRFGTVCGVSPNMRFDLMINRMVSDAIEHGVVRMRNLKVRRPILGMGDLCRGVSAILRDEFQPGHYNFCSFNSTVGEIGTNVAALMGVPVEELGPTPAYDFVMPGSFLARDTLASIVTELRGMMAKDQPVAAAP